jgi:hypothetical protein
MHDFIDGLLQRMSLGDKVGQLAHTSAQSETTTGVGVAVGDIEAESAAARSGA